MKYSRENLLALAAKLRVLGIKEPCLWIKMEHPHFDGSSSIVPISISQLTEGEARRNWMVVQHEVTAALKRNKGVWK
jgi:hypothetical protein